MNRFAVVALLFMPTAWVTACGGASTTARSGTAAAGTAALTAPPPTAAPPVATGSPVGLCLASAHGPIPPRTEGEVSVNADRDGIGDRMFTQPQPVADSPPELELVLDEHAVVGVVLPMMNVPVAPIGGFDVDGDGRDELFVKTGQGAYATLIDVYSYDPAACTLTRLTAPGAVTPAQFAVGASVGNGGGLACRDRTFVSSAIERVSDEPLRYRVQSTTYVIAGDALRAAGTTERETDVEGAAAAVTFDCGHLRLPGFPPPP